MKLFQGTLSAAGPPQGARAAGRGSVPACAGADGPQKDGLRPSEEGGSAVHEGTSVGVL
jgi:hypothetical protein